MKQYATNLVIHRSVVLGILHSPIDRSIDFQDKLNAEVGALGLVPASRPCDIVRRLWTNESRVQRERRSARIRSRTWPQDSLESRSSSYTRSRSFRIALCSSVTGTESGFRAISSHNIWTNSMRSSSVAPSNSGGILIVEPLMQGSLCPFASMGIGASLSSEWANEKSDGPLRRVFPKDQEETCPANFDSTPSR
jgi:hypothetical protein